MMKNLSLIRPRIHLSREQVKSAFWSILTKFPHVRVSQRVYGVVLLVSISLLLSSGTLMLALRAISQNNQKFCLVVSPVVAKPVIRPADPKHNKAQEQQWEWYERYKNLNASLGC